MIDTQLILVEGLPSTGKSTNSDFLRIQLERNGKKVKWIHEVARPHPALFFSEACLSRGEYDAFLKLYPESARSLNAIAEFGKNTVCIDLLEAEWNYAGMIGDSAFEAIKAFEVWNFTLEKYEEAALEKWAHFSEKAARDKDSIYILDSAVFQAQIFTFLWDNAPYERLDKFVHKLFDIVKHLNPSLIYLYREDTETTLNYLKEHRGIQSLERGWERDKARPYYQDKPKGAEGYRQFLRNYASAAMSLFDSVACKKLAVEISNLDWKRYEREMLSFLELDDMPCPAFFPPNGVYRNEEFGYEIVVCGLMIVDPDGNRKRLTPKTAGEFYAQCLPMILCFEGSEELVMSGSQINARWSTTGMRYRKAQNPRT